MWRQTTAAVLFLGILVAWAAALANPPAATGVEQQVEPKKQTGNAQDRDPQNGDAQKNDLLQPESASAASISDEELSHRALAEDHRPVSIPYEDRPEWVESVPVLTGSVHWIAVSSGPYYRKQDCLKALDRQLEQTTDHYINEQLGHPMAAQLLDYDLRTIRSQLVDPDKVHEEVIYVSFGPMHQAHALLEFDEAFRDELDRRWEQVRAAGRLLLAGLGAGGVFALLALLFGYLKLDTATGGRLRGRLRLAAAMGILTIMVGGLLLAAWVPWV